MQVKVFRKRISLSYLKDPSKPFDWHNNDANNALDVLEVYDDSGARAIVAAVQTVANMEGLDTDVHFYDTIAPGKFFLRFGVEPRQFKCQPFGIVGATTLHGDVIRDDSTTPSNPSRWLEHDRRDHNGVDTRVCWSAGCIVHYCDSTLEAFNALCRSSGLKPGDLIPCELMEVGA